MFYTYGDHELCDSLPQSLMHFIDIKRGSEHFDTNLVMFLAPERNQRSHDFYRQRFWRLLKHLHRHDPEPWPAQTPKDPHAVKWQFCFGGEEFFIFSASPSYQRRKSRNLGDCQILLMQPRSSFSILNTNANGASARAKVRTRIQQWDKQDAHPDLGVFGDPASREWKQYFLPDTMDAETGKCPFHHQQGNESNKGRRARMAAGKRVGSEQPQPSLSGRHHLTAIYDSTALPEASMASGQAAVLLQDKTGKIKHFSGG